MNQEQYNIAKTAKSAEELLELAKKNGLDITLEEATNYFEKLNDTSSVISDEELESVSGGCWTEECDGSTMDKAVTIISIHKCPLCDGYIDLDKMDVLNEYEGRTEVYTYYQCPHCHKFIYDLDMGAHIK